MLPRCTEETNLLTVTIATEQTAGSNASPVDQPAGSDAEQRPVNIGSTHELFKDGHISLEDGLRLVGLAPSTASKSKFLPSIWHLQQATETLA